MAIQETRTLPAQFVEDLGTDLSKQLLAQTGVPVVSTGIAGISQQPGETPEQYAARQKAAEQFQIRQQSLAGLAPQVAGQDPLQTRAQELAEKGIGSYEQFINRAQAATGPQAYQAYMSPYQQQVIDTTLSEFDRQKQFKKNQLQIKQLLQVLLVVVEKEYKELNFKQELQEKEHCYKLVYYNKVLVKHNN